MRRSKSLWEALKRTRSLIWSSPSLIVRSVSPLQNKIISLITEGSKMLKIWISLNKLRLLDSLLLISSGLLLSRWARNSTLQKCLYSKALLTNHLLVTSPNSNLLLKLLQTTIISSWSSSQTPRVEISLPCINSKSTPLSSLQPITNPRPNRVPKCLNKRPQVSTSVEWTQELSISRLLLIS